ncbi:hypothetical protein E3N88_12013 [Mikania micrantha]|uniref:hAT-like transposase RNase-H fold domain-containing protein n=1 Tax=Mikania micrantha TaxID=192012 RepID=A0A5N6P4B0_9ASTR|nr:hypothetical protein E3N88_12013 [Mikania micrantha]
MLETTLKFENAFERLQAVNSSYRLYFQSEVVDEESTRMSRKRKKIDKVEGALDENDFENASIASMFKSVDEKKKAMGLSMLAKFEKYWSNLDNINCLLYVALVLDPRKKMSYLEFCLSLMHGKGSKKVQEIKDLVKVTLMELFDEYKSKLDKTKDPKTTSSTSNMVDDDAFVDLEEGYLKFLEEESGKEIIGQRIYQDLIFPNVDGIKTFKGM